MRVAATAGHPIQVEVYQVPREEVGRLLVRVPPPLAIGTVELASGEPVHGFVCETVGIEGARDVSVHGGWRAYLGLDNLVVGSGKPSN